MRKAILGLTLIVIAGVTACSVLLPERFAIKGPILSQLLGRSGEAPSDAQIRGRFQLPEGYRIELFAEGIEHARVLRLSPGGDLLVSQPRLGRILLVERDGDGDGRSDGQRVLLGELDRPHGLDFAGELLYVGETDGITRVAVRESGPGTLEIVGDRTRIVEGLPRDGNHWSRTLRIGPDGGIYLHVGSSCNVCEEEDERRATIMRFERDGSGGEIFAAGLRNSVGFDWRPGTNELFATDNGRDLLGDDYPPCELNRVERGQFYGWPYVNGDNRLDPDFGEGNEEYAETSVPPVHSFRAHNAPLGIAFLRSEEHDEPLRGAALVALHGSWNRTKLDGYKVVSLHWDAAGNVTERDFLTGFEVDEDVIGRPADVLEAPDGTIYVSDDYAGAIYRVTRGLAAADAAIALPGRRSAGTGTAPLAGLDAATREALDLEGASLFDVHACATCHLQGQVAEGVVVKPLDELGSKYTIESLARFFVTPTPPMPVFELDESERRALAVHLLSRFD